MFKHAAGGMEINRCDCDLYDLDIVDCPDVLY